MKNSFQISKPVSSISVNRDGSKIILAGKQGLYVSELSKPQKIIKTFSLSSRSSQCIVEWNPHEDNQSIIISSSGKNIYLWDLQTRGRNLLSTLDSHSRAIQGLSWSSKQSNLFASCSNDTYINVWDTRTPKEVLKFKTFCSWTVGASDVKWNRSDGNLLASSHAGEVRVWDLRKETTPLTFITAHNSKINSIDWSYTQTNDLITCSQDKKVKLWTITMPRSTQATLNSQVYLTKSAFMPVGEGILTVSKEDNSLKLWKLSDLNTCALSLSGHKDIVVSSVFTMPKHITNCDLQLISLSRDTELCIWDIPRSLTIGKRGSSLTLGESPGNFDISSKNIDLLHEFHVLESLIIPGFTLLEYKDRTCTISIEHKSNLIELKIVFPTMYPNGAHPNFTIITANLSASQRSQYTQNLNNIAKNSVVQNLPCVEKIILHTIDFLELQLSNNIIEREFEVDIPCPKLAGASFSTDGTLLYFTNFSFKDNKQPLPNTYDGLKKFVVRPIITEEDASRPQTVSFYYYIEGVLDLSMKRIPSSTQSKVISKEHTKIEYLQRVTIVNINPLLIIEKNLAINYKVCANSVEDACIHNANTAKLYNREDLYKSWLLLASIGKTSLFQDLDSNQNPNIHAIRRYSSLGDFNNTKIHHNHNNNNNNNNTLNIWLSHPFAKNLLESLLLHYLNIKDIQTLAVMSCVLSLPPNPLQYYQKLPQSEKLNILSTQQTKNFRKKYSQILFKWGLAERAAEVLKGIEIEGPQINIEFGVICKYCGKHIQNSQGNCCITCQRRGFICAVCNLPVRGMSTFCFHCGHGGHTEHLKEWFSIEDVCATGCGCRCLQNHSYIQRK